MPTSLVAFLVLLRSVIRSRVDLQGGKLGSAPSSRSATAEAKTDVRTIRQAVLDCDQERLVAVEEFSGSGHDRNRHGLAPGRISEILALAFSPPAGRKPVNGEVRELILRMVSENPRRGAPHIQGELLKLGFDVSEDRVSLHAMCSAETACWRAVESVPEQHHEAIAAMDFFTVPTMTFGILYCFFVIARNRHRILHFHVTRDPDSLWIAQQLREAFPDEHRFKYLIFDGDAKFGKEVLLSAVESIELASVRTSFKSPWQNGVAERWVGSCRRDLLDHVIAPNDRHLRRLFS